MIYRVEVGRASSFCSDPPPTGQLVVVKRCELSLSDGASVRVFKLVQAPNREPTWSFAEFQRFPFFNPIGLSADPSELHESCDGYLLRAFDNFERESASSFASYFAAVECLLAPAE